MYTPEGVEVLSLQ